MLPFGDRHNLRASEKVHQRAGSPLLCHMSGVDGRAPLNMASLDLLAFLHLDRAFLLGDCQEMTGRMNFFGRVNRRYCPRLVT